jgi:hypothetical protein
MSHIQYLNQAAVRKLVKSLGKRSSGEFLLALDDLVRSRVTAACNTHNGGRVTLDATVLGHVSGARLHNA